MAKIKDFGAWILVDGEELEEFGTEVQDGGATVTCFISSVADQVSSLQSISINKFRYLVSI